MGIGGRFDLTTVGPDRVDVGGSFAPNGASSPLAASNTGKGWSVVRSGVGLYTVTFDESWPSLDSLWLSVRVADATATVIQGGDYSSSAKTLQIRVLQEAAGTFAVADLAADADNVVSFVARFRNTSIAY